MDYAAFMRDIGAKDVSDDLDARKLFTFTVRYPQSYIAMYALINQCYFNGITMEELKALAVMDNKLKSSKACSAFLKEFFPLKK